MAILTIFGAVIIGSFILVLLAAIVWGIYYAFASLAARFPGTLSAVTARTVLIAIASIVALIAVVAIWLNFAAMATFTDAMNAKLATASWLTLVTVALVLLALAYTFKDLVFKNIFVRAFKAAAFVLLWLAVGIPLLTAVLPCSETDIACQYQQAVKEEQQRQKQAAAQRAIEASRQPVAAQCNVHRMPYRFETTKPDYKFNPGGACSPQLFTEGHCVYVTQHRSEETLGPICNRGGGVPRDRAGNPISMPEDIDRVWSAEGKAFEAEVGLWQPRYTKLLSWR